MDLQAAMSQFFNDKGEIVLAPQLTLADLRRVKRQLDERGLSVECFTPEQVMYPVNIASSADWLRANGYPEWSTSSVSPVRSTPA